MIGSLIDDLNKSADEWNGSNMFELARMCREAADTIWQLRDDLQRTNADNAKLREELADAPKCETCEAMLDCDECLRADGSHKERRRLSAENAKLRELTKRMARALGVGSNLCDRNCGWEFECDLVSCPIEEAMRELGIEVDG